MATVYTRAGKGSALTWTEGDANITNLNNDKIELTDLSVGTAGTASGSGAIAYNNTSGVFTYTPPVIPAAGISDLVADTTPQLGGNLDTLGNQIRAEGENSVFVVAGGTGSVILATQLGAGVAMTDKGTQVQKLLYNEKIHSLGTTSGTVAPDVGVNGNIQTITLNGNLTINGFNNAFTGESVTLIINTGGTGRTLTSTMKFAGGEKTLSTTNTTDILSITYDGTNYWASLSKDFK